MKKFVDDCIQKGIEAKYEFKSEYPYLSEDADRLFEEFTKINGLLDFCRRTFQIGHHQVAALEHGIDERREHIVDTPMLDVLPHTAIKQDIACESDGQRIADHQY